MFAYSEYLIAEDHQREMQRQAESQRRAKQIKLRPSHLSRLLGHVGRRRISAEQFLPKQPIEPTQTDGGE